MNVDELSDQQLQRYARHILLDEIGGEGQARLLRARVLVVGAGGLGSPLILYLAAAGIGTIGVVDDDRVDLTNLQRQVIHATERVGVAKPLSARQAVESLNPDVTIVPICQRLDAGNAEAILGDFDLVADGSDNFATRLLVNDACFFLRKPLVSAAVLRFDGQLATFKPFVRDAQGEPSPCYRCFVREAPPPGELTTCAEAGVLGAFCGVMGSLQATEVIKELLGIGSSLAGWLLLCDALEGTVRRVRLRRDPTCPLCGDRPTISSLAPSEVVPGCV